MVAGPFCVGFWVEIPKTGFLGTRLLSPGSIPGLLTYFEIQVMEKLWGTSNLGWYLAFLHKIKLRAIRLKS